MRAGTVAGRRRLNASWAILLLVVVVLLWSVPPSGATAVGPRPLAPIASHAPQLGSDRSSHPSAAPAGALRPNAVTNVSIGPVYASTLISPAANNDVPCYYHNYTFQHTSNCFPQTQNPTIVSLSNGHLGLGYSIYTTVGPQCNNSTNTTLVSWTTTNVAWASSATNGTSWGGPQLIGNGTCQWPSSSEPTFATGPGARVDGAFVLSNDTVNTSLSSGLQPLFPPDWGNTTGDAIGFVTSANNGATWSTTTVVSGVTGAARPQIAVFGKTVYITYIFVPNTAAIYPIGNFYTNSPALKVQLVYSSNGGTTWHGPYTLPGENASFGNWSTSPSIAVNDAGTVGVAYATNRSCVGDCAFPLYANYADSVVVATSGSNGTSWSTPSSVGGLIGELPYAQDYYDNYYEANQYPWMTTPQTSIAYSTSSDLYLAYAGGYLKGASLPYYYNYEDSGVFAATSTNGGTSWTSSTVNAPLSTNNYDDVYSPAVSVLNGTPYIAYVWSNDSYCSTSVCSPLVGGYSSWVATTTNGVNWSSTYSAISPMYGPYDADAGWQGWESSVAFTSNGSVVTATTLPGMETFGFVGINASVPVYAETDYANVSVGFVYSGATTSVEFIENNLSAGTTWGVAVDGYAGQASTKVLNVSNVPVGIGVSITVLPQSAAYRTIESSTLSIPPFRTFSGPSVAYVNYSIAYGVEFTLEPFSTPYEEIDFQVGITYYDLYENNGAVFPSQPLPWYFPGGTPILVYSGGEPPITYWNGTGPGSYTGGGTEANLTVTAPMNETAWAGSYGIYSVGFHATGLPAASVYSFSFDGGNYSAASTSWANVSNVGTGGYSVTNITANSSLAGWEYFGWVPGGSNVVVVPAEPNVDFQFAYVDMASPSGTVTFHATGIGTGTIWSVEFNGTYYSASTPWLNVSTRTGTFPWAVGSAVAANASVGYAPVGTGGSVSVTTGSTVNISYTSAYRVDVIAGLGGAVSNAGDHWLASGASSSYTAAPSTGYAFGGWTGTGTGSYTGSNLTASVTADGAVTETASFYPLPSDRFNVTFQQTTIPTGTWWTVYLNGVGYSSDTQSLTVSNLLSCAAGTAGQYNESIPYAYDGSSGATRYTAVSPPKEFCTNGGLLQTLTFAPEYQITVSATQGGSAYVADSVTNVVSNESLWAQPTDTVQLTAIHATGFTFGGWNGTGIGEYTGTDVNPPVSPGGPVTEFATFVPPQVIIPPRYTETFVSSVAFPAGTSWSVKVGTTSYAGVGPKIVVSGLLAGTYPLTVSVATSADGLTRWAPATPTEAPLHVTASQNQTVTFGKPSFWVTIGGSSGGTEGPSSGWELTGTVLSLNASPDLGQTFVGWQGTGDGNYTGNQSSTTLTVVGPVSEFANFQPVQQAATVVTSFWSSTTTWAILGLVGLLAGLIVGIAIRRFGRDPPAAKPAEPMAPWSPGETGTSGSDTTGGGGQ
jgi:hypothetical protein